MIKDMRHCTVKTRVCNAHPMVCYTHHITGYQWCVPFWYEIHTVVCPLLDGISATMTYISVSRYE